jgi:IS605 OrfB family transposase
MKSDGTVLARRFINFACEKDHLYHVLGRIRKAQREHGSRQCRSFWAYAVRLNKEAADRTGAAIAAFAKETGADVIVFEHLDINGKIRGSKKQKLALWKKQGIQKICEQQAHRMGIRIFRICPRNTSAFAYDGSGKVERDQKNHSLCRFANGKQYNCDLSASYNIGARYFIREITKPLPETARSLLEAKVPSIKRRTSCVYADLVKLVKILGEEQAA